MSIEARENAIEARLLTMVDRPPTAWPNAGYVSDGSLYIEVQHFHNRPGRPTLSATQRRPGITQITVVAPENGYATEANVIADALIALFPVDLALSASAETVRTTQDAYASGGFAADGEWRLPVSIFWEVIS